jgi:RHS repeat-associated protein
MMAVAQQAGSQHKQYVYNAEGHRVAKLNADSSVAVSYIIGPGGEQITELNGSGQWQHSNVWVGGQLLATYDQNGLHFHFSDWLGTRRVQTAANGLPEESWTSLPFGDGMSPSGNGADATEHHFTGKERDSESGNDYFGARYYASSMGRFLSPDWSATEDPVPYAKLDDPQSLNLYGYVNNNPLSKTDSDGHSDSMTFCNTACRNQPVSQGELQVDTGILEISAGTVTGNAGLDALGAGNVLGATLGVIGGTGYIVSGSSRILGTAAGAEPEALNRGAEGVQAATNPVSAAVSSATGSVHTGNAVNDVVSGIKIAKNPAEAAKNPADTALTVKSLVQDVKGAVSAVKTAVTPPPAPAPPKPPSPPPCATSKSGC